MAVFECDGMPFPCIHILTAEGIVHPLYPRPLHFYALRVDTGTMARRFNVPEGKLIASIRAHPEFGERIFERGVVIEEEKVPPNGPDPPARQAPDIPPDDQGLPPEEARAADVLDAVLGDQSPGDQSLSNQDFSPASEGAPPTEGEAVQPVSPSLTCSECGLVCGSARGLLKHLSKKHGIKDR